jgi:tetratricopeptide (TPR) repeat protein
MSAEQAERYKAQGNAALSARRYSEAADLYSKAIALEPSEATYFSNRAAAYAALEEWQQSLDDSYEVVTLRPEWAKGWVRRGGAFMGLKKHEEARKAYLKASQLESSNHQIKQLLEGAEVAVAKSKERQWENDLWSDDEDAQPQPKRSRTDSRDASSSAQHGDVDPVDGAPRRKSKPGAALLAQLDRSLKDASEDSLRACLGQLANADEAVAERVLHVLEGLNAASSAGEDDDEEERAGLGGRCSDDSD